MLVYRIVALFLFFYISFRGNLMLTTLYAINLQATSFEIGLIVALANFGPMLFAVIAGIISDRFEIRHPLALGSIGLGLSYYFLT